MASNGDIPLLCVLSC